MASDSTSIWHRIGYALEQARQTPAAGAKKLRSLATRDSGDASDTSADAGSDRSSIPVDSLVTTGAVALAGKALDSWRPTRNTSVGSLLRAGAAGAAAAFLVELVRPLLRGDVDRPDLGSHTPEHLLAGMGQGLVYGAVVEPWLPGPPLLKGALFGSAEYALNPAGGVTKLLGSRSPLGRVPFVLKLLEDLESEERGFTEHLAFGVAIGVLYGLGAGLGRSSSGMDEEG